MPEDAWLLESKTADVMMPASVSSNGIERVIASDSTATLT